MIGTVFFPLFFEIIDSSISDCKEKSFNEFLYIKSRFEAPSQTIIGKIKVKFDIFFPKIGDLQLEER